MHPLTDLQEKGSFTFPSLLGMCCTTEKGKSDAY